MTSDVERMLTGYGLTTAEIFYRMPDHQNVLNTFVWQEYDLAPDHPRLFRFIEFWQDRIEGPLHSVRFVHRKEVAAGEWRHVTGEYWLN
ncbi:uncharacterized protein Usg [Aliiruegeria haliotis]|uniref:Uncharacterized protein Usg n=1 Tax=Aliiruegeria haliotis TaxID=1280846 RepID=A0A2T0RZR7_9RHOB|nr:usg protein [Aliiruegeria haliotis]PRY26669.1 uncharacterized protein Usg [Aliiruegeria haliotis]